ncbi:hypothetical protein BKA70DRAFT_678515 [Coprinopsis sp. MPI-PUGE-AT-0042]|nr:hypothetical protein BKA70DRAFT_678515 [Coprinopsis sp. MPI-PUGE-AT-0042]
MDAETNQNVVVISPPDEETQAQSSQSAIGLGAPPSPRNSPTRTRIPPRLGHSRSASLSTGPALSPLRNTFGPSVQSTGTNGTTSNPNFGFPSPSPTSLRFAFPGGNGGPQSNLAPTSQPRIRSISANYSAIPSPLALSNGFPHSPDRPNALPSSTTLPNMGMGFGLGPPSPNAGFGPPSPSGSEPYLPLDSGTPPPPAPTSPVNGISPATAAAHHKRRHSRMHSRNLSVFFPRPGQVPSAIDEDGDADTNGTHEVLDEEGQELEVPSSYIPSAGSSVNLPGSRKYSRGNGGSNNNPPVTPLGAGFKFGSRPPPDLLNNNSELPPMEEQIPRAKKRGHHHKHSMSHNFFSFLEPGSGSLPPSRGSELHTQPTPTPMSPWVPISAFPESAKPGATGRDAPYSAVPVSASMNGVHGHGHSYAEPPRTAPYANVVGIAEFALGAYIWVLGQQIGSLSVTGLGYWIVFDSFGVGVGCVLPGRLAASLTRGGEKVAITRPYGNGRYETLYLFSQAVYLMFSGVYICKETVEHLLLSAGGEGHHHHSGDEERGGHAAIQFPLFILFSTLLSLIGTALVYENNARLVNLAGNRMPSPHALLRGILQPFQPRSNRRANSFIEPPPSHPLLAILTNPYAVWPMAFCVGIMGVALGVPSEHHRLADLCLSSLIAVVTFNVAYRACVVLGAVLLQTSPPRGLPSGKMESFLRAMREIERHPDVLHLPAPHIWQLTASAASLSSSSASSISSPAPGSRIPQSKAQPDQLVVTLQLHVKPDLADDDVLALTKWVWEKCVGALGGYKEFREVGEVGGPEISVGVVRG